MAITKISPSVVDFDAGITISTTDNSTNLTLSSTDADANGGPILDFYRNSSSPADNDVLFQSNIYAENDADEKVAYGYINTFATDVSNGSESMKLNLNMYSAGTALNRFELSSSETVFNQDSGDIDFRVESDGNANMLFVDGGKNTVAIGADAVAVFSSYAQLNIGSLVTIAGETASGASKSLQISHNAHLDTDGSWEAIATDEVTNYYQHGGAHVFRAAASTTAGADISWTTAGQFNINGLCFGTDTAAANALDDYEEGTWTPYFQGTSSNGSTSYATQQGYYTKVGRLVTAQFYVGGTWSGNYTGQVLLNGFPYSIASGHGGNWQAVGTYNIDNNAEAAYLAGSGGTNYFLLYVTGSGTGWGNVTWGSKTGSSGATIYLAGHVMYHV